MFTGLLIRLFVKDYQQTDNASVRLGYGVLAGFAGVVMNLVLFAVKVTIGVIAGSVAVIADAVNNLSDSGSALVTLFGFKLSAQPPDEEHPFGHGRIEYIAGMIVAVLIVSVGLNFLKESVMRIINPSQVSADWIIISILAASMLIKVWLFFFYRTVGKKIDSQVILAAAFDSLSDLLSTSLVLVSIIVGRFTSFPVDGCAGVLVAGLVIWGGIGIIREAGSPLLGERPEPQLVEELKRRLMACPDIAGVHDIVVHNYGPNLYFATAHAEVDRYTDVVKIHDILESVEVDIARSMPIRLLLHCDPFEIDDPTVKMWRAKTEEAVSALDSDFKLYDFRYEEENGNVLLRFQLLIPREYRLSEEEITENLQKAFAAPVKLEIRYNHAYV